MRSVIVVSASHFNMNSGGLIVVVPVTRTDRGNPLHVEILPAEGGLRHRSFALCDMVRSISSDRLEYFVGRLDIAELEDIADRPRIILDL